MDPKETIKKNLERRSLVVDRLETINGIPIPSWIELSIIDVCNRKCIFCPKVDPLVAPDTFQKMSRTLINKIHHDLDKMKFNGIISLCGYGEPLLHKDINYIVKKLSEVSSVEIITNGDVLNSKIMQDLYLAKVSKILVSMYDGPEQIDKFKKITRDANVPEDLIILRDRWYDKYNDFGVKLTNRAGTVRTGVQEEVNIHTNCFYPTYQMLVDWNGNVYLCPQDWHRRIPMGNVMQETILEIWTGKIFSRYRKNLLNGKRCENPCNLCNADGKLLGKNHAIKWMEVYEKK